MVGRPAIVTVRGPGQLARMLTTRCIVRNVYQATRVVGRMMPCSTA